MGALHWFRYSYKVYIQNSCFQSIRLICFSFICIKFWIWAHFPAFAPAMAEERTRQIDRRWACRWTHRATPPRTLEKVHNITTQLDTMRAEDVRFMPYEDRFINFDADFQVSRYRGVLSISDIQEPYMPDRVLRQFGRVQSIPMDRIPPTIETRPTGTAHLKLTFSDMFDVWDQ